MKLFLSSQAISSEQAPAFFELVGKRPEDVRFALIENAADVERNKSFVKKNDDAFRAVGLKPLYLDLTDAHMTASNLEYELSHFYDVVWFGGGNTYYLRWLLWKSGLDQVLPKLVHRGLVYGGGSAGAIVAGLTLKHFEQADNPSKAPSVVENGLQLVNFVAVPHWDNAHYGPIMRDTKARLEADGFATMTLTDAQAVVVDGHIKRVIPD